jgi:hypothetical protein
VESGRIDRVRVPAFARHRRIHFQARVCISVFLLTHSYRYHRSSAGVGYQYVDSQTYGQICQGYRNNDQFRHSMKVMDLTEEDSYVDEDTATSDIIVLS